MIHQIQTTETTIIHLPRLTAVKAGPRLIDYYTNELTNLGFKQSLNSSEPTGTTITFAKEDLFLTFGIKNIYSGSGDNKKLVGYKAFIEHN
ncbi:hypothetical protein HYU94_00205 [Candidatus Daviesbacteria bacterium]|nr:hypothetical protein [Candidatus Daviesbacteria bacterium]